MSKFSENLKKYLKAYLFTFVISFLFGALVFVLIFFLSKNKMTVVGALNSSAISAVILLSFGILAFVSSCGMFDSMTYGFSQLGSSMFAKKANRHHDFQSYREEKMAKRQASANYYVAILFASVPFVIAATVLLIIVETY